MQQKGNPLFSPCQKGIDCCQSCATRPRQSVEQSVTPR